MFDTSQEMQKFIQASSEFLRYNSDTCLIELQQHLDNLAQSEETSQFDPTLTIATQFYSYLHELMNSLDSRSMLIWPSVSVLQKACNNENARSALIHTYKFIPVLTRFLSTSHSDKQLRLLQLLTKITYGAKILWQEAHLPHLISTLVQIILEGENDHRTSALTVLVNLCYENLSVVYVLLRKVEIKKFIKSITKFNDSPGIRMRICKMLIILEQTKGALPEADILNFIGVSFYSVSEALQSKDVDVLTQTVDFFNNVIEKNQYRTFMSRYPKCYEDTKQIVDMLEKASSDEDEVMNKCRALGLQFVSSVLMLNLEKTQKLLRQLLQIALNCLGNDTTCLSALNVLKMVTEISNNQTGQHDDCDIRKTLAESVPKVFESLSLSETNISAHRDKEKLFTFVSLLVCMASESELRNSLLKMISSSYVRKIFQDILAQNSSDQQLSLQPDVTNLCVRLLSLVSSLAIFSGDWMSLYVDLINQRQILWSVAVSFQAADKTLKYEILRLTSTPGWSKESLTLLCDIMNETHASGMTDSPARSKGMSTRTEYVPMYHESQESRLNELLDGLRTAKQEGRLTDSSTSAVMELYEYKLASMIQSERTVVTALEAADARCGSLGHQVAQLKGELTHLYQLFFSAQQCKEGVTAEKNDLMEKLVKMNEQIAQENNRHNREIKALRNTMHNLEVTLNKKESELNTELAKREELTAECSQLRNNLQACQQKCEEMEKANASANENLQKAKSQIAEYEEKMKDFQAEANELRRSLTESMNKNSQKDQEIADCNKKIDELDRIRQMVMNVAARKEKF